MDEILNHLEKQAQKHGTLNYDIERKEDTCVKSNSDTQQSNIEEHNLHQIPINSEQKPKLKHISVHGNRDKPDENTNTCT